MEDNQKLNVEGHNNLVRDVVTNGITIKKNEKERFFKNR